MRQLSLTFSAQAAQFAPCAVLPVAGRPTMAAKKSPEDRSSRVSAGAKKKGNATKEDKRKPWQRAPLKDPAAEAKIKHPKRSPKPAGCITIKTTA